MNSVLIRKVFSQRIMKSYWLARDKHNPVHGDPVFTLEEAEYIKTNGLTDEELLWCWEARKNDGMIDIIPLEEKEIDGDIGLIEVRPTKKRKPEDTRPESVIQAQLRCLEEVMKGKKK